MLTVHNYDKRLEGHIKTILGLKNGKLALSFLNHLKALGLSKARITKYANYLTTLLRIIDFDLKKATKKDVERVAGWINSQNYAEWTKRDKKLTLKKLIQYAKHGCCDKDTPYPPEVSWIKLGSIRDDNTRITPENLLTIEDVKAMLRAAKHPMHKALISLAYETSARPEELLTMEIKNINFENECCMVTMKGKTGLKTIPVVTSYKYLLEWINQHPARRNPEAPLWIMIGKGSSQLKPLSYDAYRMLLKRIAKKAGINKPVWPYLLRHSNLTNLAKKLPEATLSLYAGWIQGSKMPRRYIHFSARDLKNEILKLHGIKTSEEEKEETYKLKVCPKCGTKNEPDKVRCSFCGLILDQKLAISIFEEEKRRQEEILKRVERLEQISSQLLNRNPGQAS